MMVLCDRSSSANGYSCTPENIEAAGRMWVQKADEAGGGKFEIFLIDSGFDATPVIFSDAYPAWFPGPITSHKNKWRVEFLHKLKGVHLPTNRGSAIAEAICRCSLRIPRDGETVVYVMSDMREVNDTFNLEKQVPIESEFICWLEANAIMPKFSGSTRVVVCGMHPYSPDGTSIMTAKNYNKLLTLWQAVFRKWGVRATVSEECDFGN
jgi:hypothetical protein